MSKPDTQTVRAFYATANTFRQSPVPVRSAAFDHWLEGVKHAARAEAWDAAALYLEINRDKSAGVWLREWNQFREACDG